MKALGTIINVVFIGISGAMSQMLSIHDMALETQGTMMMTVWLSLGAIVGELLRIDYRCCMELLFIKEIISQNSQLSQNRNNSRII